MSTYQAPTRAESQTSGTEAELLASFLDANRSTLLAKCDGLTLEQLQLRPVEHSSMSLLGLVRHMALVEQWWFDRIFLGSNDELVFSDPSDPDYEWNSLESSLEETFAVFNRCVERSRDAVSERGLGEEAIGSDRRGGYRTLRWIYLHMLDEYARHNGHADLLRELIDGRVGF